MNQFSNDARLIAATTLFSTGKYDLQDAWADVDLLISAAPAPVKTTENTELCAVGRCGECHRDNVPIGIHGKLVAHGKHGLECCGTYTYPAPTGDKVTPVEPTEEEWRKAFMVTDDEPFSTFCARMTAEARRLAALRKEER